MVARGDAVLVGLVGFMALFVGAWVTISSGFQPGLAVVVVLVIGIVVFALAIVLYSVAGPSPWSGPSWGQRTMVTLACPVYGTPLAWVDEVGQWFCPQCQAYHGARPA